MDCLPSHIKQKKLLNTLLKTNLEAIYYATNYKPDFLSPLEFSSDNSTRYTLEKPRDSEAHHIHLGQNQNEGLFVILPGSEHSFVF